MSKDDKNGDFHLNITELYRGFQAPITDLDCGKKCGPLNRRGAPFCCDTRHSVPAAYKQEWDYLREKTDLWHLWQGNTREEHAELQAEVQDGQLLLECLGHKHCQRQFRTLACRAFPFYPYLNAQGRFLGLAGLADYSDRCWVLSNLGAVSSAYRQQFVSTFDRLFQLLPEARAHYQVFSQMDREDYQHSKRELPLLHRDGFDYFLIPEDEKLHQVKAEDFPEFEPYASMRKLPFPGDEE